MAGGTAAGLMHEVNNVIWMTLAMLDVSLTPDASQLPFSGTLQDLVNGLAAISLILTAGAFAFGGASWALGNATGNMSWAERGKQSLIVAALGALAIGGAAIIVNFFFHLGNRLH